MREQLEARLQALKSEFERGQQKLQDLERQATEMRNTMLRISGAIQVLQEELGIESETPENGDEQQAS